MDNNVLPRALLHEITVDSFVFCDSDFSAPVSCRHSLVFRWVMIDQEYFNQLFFFLFVLPNIVIFFFFLPNCRVFFVYRDVMNSETWTTLRTLNSYNKSLKHRLKYVWIMWRNYFLTSPLFCLFHGIFLCIRDYSNANVGPRCIFWETINCL